MERGSDTATMDTISLNVSRIVKQSGGKMAMNVRQLDVSIKASTTTKCSDEMRRIRQRGPKGLKRAVNEAFVGVYVTTVCGEPTLLKVKAIAFDKLAGSPTKFEANPNETFAEYFRRKHGATTNPTLPVLHCRVAGRSKASRPVPYPADLLLLSTLNPAQLSSLPTLCAIYPNGRSKPIAAALQRALGSLLMMTVLQQYSIRMWSQRVMASGKGIASPPHLRTGGAEQVQPSRCRRVRRPGRLCAWAEGRTPSESAV
ncbi:hypothetical protein CUR178_06885 [Leishmania enriettii]|uniref:PAZ domain-containing protein n=1 Tax=Leishmania enriettii TaxID=5663 RepID=A0A836HM58_LEIEN|nr:hypothetical protein CUR178_06885 [Leishmania enriettii]